MNLKGFGWFETLAHELHAIGLSQPLSVLTPLLPIQAVTGPSYWIEPPGGNAISPMLNLVIRAPAGSQIRQAMDGLFMPVNSLQKLANIDAAMLTNSQVDKNLSEAISQLFTLDRKIEKLTGEEGLVQPLLESAEVIKAKQERNELKQFIRRMTVSRRPNLVVQDTPLEQLLDPRQLAFDGAVTHLSTSGTAWFRLSALGRAAAAGLAATVSAGWRPSFQSEKIKSPFHDLVSAIWVFNHDQCHTFLTSRRMQDKGLPDQFLVVDGASESVDLQPYWSRHEAELTERLERLWNHRTSGGVTVLEMTEDAGVRYLTYVRDRHECALRLGGQAFQLLDRIAPLLAKLALSLHLVKHQDPECLIDDETIRSASVLCDHCVRSQLSILAEYQRSQPGDTDIQMIERRLHIRGPMSMRDLQRSFHAVRKDDIVPMIEKAKENGAVVELDGKFALRQKGQDV